MAFQFPTGVLRHTGQVLQRLRRVSGHEEPQPLHGWQPSVYGYPEAPMRSVANDVFAMPEVTVEGETYDCVILAVDRHSGYIVAVPGKKSKKKDKKDKHGVGLPW